MKRLFSESGLIRLIRIAASVASVAVSLIFIDDNYITGLIWIPGVVFSVTILSWQMTSFRSIVNWRNLAFLAASIGIYVVVVIICVSAISGLVFNWIFGDAEGRYFMLYLGGVLLGSVLLPFAQKFLLGAALQRTLITITCVYGSFVLAWLINIFVQPEFNYKVSVVIWQTAYLTAMFAFRKKGIEYLEVEEKEYTGKRFVGGELLETS